MKIKEASNTSMMFLFWG